MPADRPRGAATRRRTSPPWHAAALACFTVALLASFDGFWGADLRARVPLRASARPSPLVAADYRTSVWTVGRNADALLHHPRRLFDAGVCHPAPASLARVHPLIAPSLLALPVQGLVGEPVASFDAAFFLGVLLGAGAMYLLVASWTASPPAGIAAGLLYAFHPVQIQAPFHFFTRDNAWLLLGLFFALRLFTRRRWSDAVALGLCGALQASTSFYPLLGSAALALPVGVWLALRYGVDRSVAARLGVAGAVAGLGAWAVLAPYLELQAQGVHDVQRQIHAAWSVFLPGQRSFPGWTALFLVAAGLALGRDRCLRGIAGDPRPALLVGAALAALLATGGGGLLPDLYAGLAAPFPALRSLRIPGELVASVHQAVCILAGFGAAGLLRLRPGRAAVWLAAAGLALVFFETTGWRPFSPRPAYKAYRIRPAPELIAFFAELDSRGPDGPILEVPLRARREDGSPDPDWRPDLSTWHLLNAYHRRPTSSCYGFHPGRALPGLERLGRQLLDPERLDAIRALGFTTVVVHHPEGREFAADYARRLARVALDSEGRLRPIASRPGLSAYALGPPRRPAPAPGRP